MRLLDFLDRRLVLPDLAGRTKTGVLTEVAKHIGQAGNLKAQEIYEVLEARERLGSTGIGSGVAFPHATFCVVSRVTAIVGRSREGIEFDAADGKPVHRHHRGR